MNIFKTHIIEFFGLPKTGKTSTVVELKKQFELEGRKVDIVKERAAVSPIQDKLHPVFNYWTAISFIKEYIEANERGVEILIADRGLLDSIIWVNSLSKRINDTEYYDQFKNLVDQKFVLKNYMVSFYLQSDIDVILERENYIRKQEKREVKGRIMNEDVLNDYSNSYLEVKDLINGISPIVEIDTSEISIPSIVDHALNYIYDAVDID